LGKRITRHFTTMQTSKMLEGASKEQKKDEWRMKGTTFQKNEKVADWLTPDVEL
jgi:hypothetical protein